MHRSSPTRCLAQTCRAVARDFPALTNARRQVTAVLRRRWRRDEEVGRALIHRGSAWLFACGTVSISSSGGSSPAPLSPFVHASLFFASCSYPYLSCRLCLPLSILSMVDCRREIENTFYVRGAGQNSYGCRFGNNGGVESAVYVPSGDAEPHRKYHQLVNAGRLIVLDCQTLFVSTSASRLSLLTCNVRRGRIHGTRGLNAINRVSMELPLQPDAKKVNETLIIRTH